MALDANDLIYPAGKLQESMFPGKDLASNLAVWVPMAEEKASAVGAANQDDAATHYAYYLAYSAVADRIASQPTRESYAGPNGTNSTRDWGQNRAEYWAGKAQEELDAFNAYLPSPPDGTRQWPPVSGTVRLRPRW